MPQGKRPLTATQIATIRRWIEEGAVDDSTPGAASDGYRVGRSAPYGYSESGSSASGMIDTTFVPATAIGVVVIRPAQIMSAPIVTIEENKTLLDANDLMAQSHLRHLGVTRDSKLVGMISVRDLVVFLTNLPRK